LDWKYSANIREQSALHTVCTGWPRKKPSQQQVHLRGDAKNCNSTDFFMW